MACKGSKASLAINDALHNLSASYEISVQQRLLQAKVLPIFLYGAELNYWVMWHRCQINCISAANQKLSVLEDQLEMLLCLQGQGLLLLAAFAHEQALIYFIKLNTVFNRQSPSLHIQAIGEQISMAQSGLPCWDKILCCCWIS